MIRQLFIILMFFMVIPLSAEGKETTLNILYTGALNGELEPCGCSPKTDFGGLARMSGYILHNRTSLYPYILVDAGNFSDRDTEQGRLKAEAIMKAFTAMKYDAVAFMGNEKTFSDDFFATLIQRYEIPFVSDTFPCKKAVSASRGPLNIALRSVPDDPGEESINILVTDKSSKDLKTAQGWDVIISSSGAILDEPVKLNGAVFVSGYPKGKHLGILTLYIDDSGNITRYKHRLEKLGADREEDAIIRKVLDDYDSRVAALMKSAERPPSGVTYLGVAQCGKCHQTYVESWKQTKHAAAFASLEEVGKGEDPECIICHSVGFGETGGFYTIDTTPELANVQCEECHGLNREHVNDFEKPMRHVTVSVCLKCHTKDNSPDFDYENYLEKVIH